MREKITPYLKKLTHIPAISRQYQLSDNETEDNSYNDPLQEDEHEVVKGLVHKYANRALIKVSYQCAAHCRFCTRIRQIGKPEGTLTIKDIDNIITYLTVNKQIDDVILSGGDPLYCPSITLQILDRLQHIDSIKVLRIGSRLPLQLPSAIKAPALAPLLTHIKEISASKPFYILLHINHPSELTPEAIEAIRHLRSLGVTLLSQTVFLKGVNDDENTLTQLYKELYYAGVIPYYLYHCDNVHGIQHFAVAIARERAIATELTAKLSGIACPTYVIDIENGYGKIPVALNFTNTDANMLSDFNGNSHIIK